MKYQMIYHLRLCIAVISRYEKFVKLTRLKTGLMPSPPKPVNSALDLNTCNPNSFAKGRDGLSPKYSELHVGTWWSKYLALGYYCAQECTSYVSGRQEL